VDWFRLRRILICAALQPGGQILRSGGILMEITWLLFEAV